MAFQKGNRLGAQHGGGSGRPRRTPDDVVEFLREAQLPAARVLVEGLKATRTVVVVDEGPDGFPITEQVPDQKIRNECALALRDWYSGKPKESLELSGSTEAPLQLALGTIMNVVGSLSPEDRERLDGLARSLEGHVASNPQLAPPPGVPSPHPVDGEVIAEPPEDAPDE